MYESLSQIEYFRISTRKLTQKNFELTNRSFVQLNNGVTFAPLQSRISSWLLEDRGGDNPIDTLRKHEHKIRNDKAYEEQLLTFSKWFQSVVY